MQPNESLRHTCDVPQSHHDMMHENNLEVVDLRLPAVYLGRVRLGSSGLGGLLRFRMRRSIGLIQIRMSHPSSSGSSENSRMSSDQGVVKYGILQLPGSDELDTHVAHGRTRPHAQGVVYINLSQKDLMTPSSGSQSNGRATQIISSHLIL